MRTLFSRLRPWLRFAASLGAMAGTVAAAHASVVSPMAVLPPANGVYVGENAPGCFSAVGVCVGSGTLAITSVIGSTFDATGQHLVLDTVYSSAITDLSDKPIGTLSLTGEIDESIDGRTGPTNIGSWTTALDKIDLSGIVLGDPVSIGPDPSHPTTGTTSITPMGSEFLIASFFDVFADITIDTAKGPLTVSRGPLRVDLAPMPEPATIFLLAVPLAGLLLFRRRDRTSPAARPV